MTAPEKLARYEQVLRELANPENWLGNPESVDAKLCGHFTPYELAVEALIEAGELMEAVEPPQWS